MITDEQRFEQVANAKRVVMAIQLQQHHDKMEKKSNATMMEALLHQMQVVEIYSSPRVAAMAKKMGIRQGWSLDLTTCERDGRPWDFNQVEMKNRAIRKVLRDKFFILIGSPMCGPFRIMHNINHCRMDFAEVSQRIEYGRRHLKFCSQLYKIQVDNGRYFLHEHPETATSWQESCIRKLFKEHGVERVVEDQCMYGLKSYDGSREGLARKCIGFQTNSPCIAKQLSKRCPNRSGNTVHVHVRLENGRAKEAHEYPDKLCRAICLGMQEQVEADRAGKFLLTTIGVEDSANNRSVVEEVKKMEQKYKTVEEEDMEPIETTWDDVSGKEFDFVKVKVARQEEVEYVREKQFYTKVPVSECMKETGEPPISVRWIDITKGDQEHPNYRSRLVAREFNTRKRQDFFPAIFPLEAPKTVISMTATSNRGEIIMINDISRAYFHARTKRDVYVQIADEDELPHEQGMCGKLQFSMYGTRDAAQNWFEEYSNQLKSFGFQRGKATPCVFFHEQRKIRTMVHGDDYVSAGMARDLQWMQKQLESKYQVKAQFFGPGQ